MGGNGGDWEGEGRSGGRAGVGSRRGRLGSG